MAASSHHQGSVGRASQWRWRRSCGCTQSQHTCTELLCRQCATRIQRGAAPFMSSVLLGRTVVKRVCVVVQARQTLGVAGIANLREPREHLAQVGVLCMQKSACLLRTQLQGQRRDTSMTASACRLSRARCAHHDVHHAARVGHVVVHLRRGSEFSKSFSEVGHSGSTCQAAVVLEVPSVGCLQPRMGSRGKTHEGYSQPWQERVSLGKRWPGRWRTGLERS